MAERCCSQFPLFTTSRTKLAVRRRREWPGLNVADIWPAVINPSRTFWAYQRNHASQKRMRSQVEVSQVCWVSVASAISQREFRSCRLYGTRPSGSSRWVFPQCRHSITLRRIWCVCSPCRTLRMQVPCTLSGPPQIGQTLLSWLKIFVFSPLRVISKCAMLIMVCERKQRFTLVIENVAIIFNN